MHSAHWIIVLLVLFLGSPSVVFSDAFITLDIGGFTIPGNSLVPNNFGVSGHIGGLATAWYNVAITRVPHGFTTDNLKISVSGVSWLIFNVPTQVPIINSPTSFGISGIIPANAECGDYEMVTVTVRTMGTPPQLVLTQAFKIENAIQLAPVAKFTLNGSSAVSPNVIAINMDITPNITFAYTGWGGVTQYRLYLEQCSSTGIPVMNGWCSNRSWIAGTVPASVNVKNLLGGTFIPSQLAKRPGYYLLTLEVNGTMCAYDCPVHREVGECVRHRALLMTKNLLTPVLPDHVPE